MAINCISRTILLATGALLVGACTSQPRESLQEKYFQQEAQNYQKYQHEGQIVYCQSQAQPGTRLVPYDPNTPCITETALRQRVEDARRERNPVMPAQVQRG